MDDTGLSPSLDTLDQVRVVNRFSEICEGPLADMMWSDPDPSVTSFQPSNRYGSLARWRDGMKE